MNRAFYVLVLLFVIYSLMLCGCVNSSDEHNNKITTQSESDETEINYVSFDATVIEAGENTLLVEPAAGTVELNSSDRISTHINEDTEIPEREIKAGDNINITYDGLIAESYPVQIRAVKIRFADSGD